MPPKHRSKKGKRGKAKALDRNSHVLVDSTPTRHGRCIDEIVIGGNNTNAHIGDTIINNYHCTTSSPTNHYALLSESLKFSCMDARLRNVTAALPKTCEWLLQHDQFLAWTDATRKDEHHGFLWIKGKPGSGKSTVMKETLAWAEKNWSSQLILSYFFNAPAPGQLEKSSIGLYRSLVHQLLEALPTIHALFEKKFVSKICNKQVEDWQETELQNFLIDIIETLSVPSLAVFVDALDEGDGDDTRRMVRFLERFTQHAFAANRNLRICLSSRHYPHITIQKCASLVMEQQAGHSQDIELYIRSELTGYDNLQDASFHQAIRDRSRGVFLWVVLVVPLLNKAYDKGESSDVVFEKLKQMPQDLHSVFDSIFRQDTENLDECWFLLRWILFSKRPLEGVELYHIMRYSHSKIPVYRCADATDGTVTRYLIDRSRGLVETTTTEPPTLQFIHETVRDYLLRRHEPRQYQACQTGLNRMVPEFKQDECHSKMAKECLTYLLALNGHNPLTEQGLVKYKMADYSAKKWWQHLKSNRTLCRQKDVDLAMELLGRKRNLLLWVRLSDVDKMWERNIEKTMDSLHDRLYYAASLGIPEIVSRILSLNGYVCSRSILEQSMHGASIRGYGQTLEILLSDSTRKKTLGQQNLQDALSRQAYGRILKLIQNAVGQSESTNSFSDSDNSRPCVLRETSQVLVEYCTALLSLTLLISPQEAKGHDVEQALGVLTQKIARMSHQERDRIAKKFAG